jgi:Ricin-type beta-trefoil lectin domain/Lysozyme like domain
MIRQSLIAALTGTIVLGATWAATASAGHYPWRGSATTNAGPYPARVSAESAIAGSRPAGPADRPRAAAESFAPRATGIALSGAALAAAAGRCATWASEAGFAANGYLAGSLTTAVAVALAESGCNPAACFDETTGAACAAQVPLSHSVDRGAWQINGRNPGRAAVRCAFSGPCSARAAYNSFSLDGTYFSRWSTYLFDIYARFLPAAQVAVNALAAGTVPSGLTGWCLGYPSDAAGARAMAEKCGRGASDEQWTVTGSTLQTSGGLCLAAASRRKSGPVALRACDGSALQRWLPHADAELYNPAARRCLTNPEAAARPGAVISDLACNGMPDQAWFKP